MISFSIICDFHAQQHTLQRESKREPQTEREERERQRGSKRVSTSARGGESADELLATVDWRIN